MIVALEIATGKVVAHVRNRRTSPVELSLRFMNEVVRAFPTGNLMVVDNLNIHKNEAALGAAGRAILKSAFTTPSRTPCG